METANLIHMANRIGEFFAALPDPELAVRPALRASGSAGTEVSWPPQGGGGVSNVDDESVETRACAATPLGLDPDATRIAAASASTQLSFSTGPDAAPEAMLPPPPQRVARPTRESSSRSAIPIVAMAAIAAAFAVAVFVATSGDDGQAAPAARGETPATPSGARATTDAKVSPPPSVDPSPEVALPASSMASTSAAPAAAPSAPKVRNDAGPTARAPYAGATTAAPASPPKPSAGAPASRPATVDPEWGVPVLRP